MTQPNRKIQIIMLHRQTCAHTTQNLQAQYASAKQEQSLSHSKENIEIRSPSRSQKEVQSKSCRTNEIIRSAPQSLKDLRSYPASRDTLLQKVEAVRGPRVELSPSFNSERLETPATFKPLPSRTKLATEKGKNPNETISEKYSTSDKVFG